MIDALQPWFPYRESRIECNVHSNIDFNVCNMYDLDIPASARYVCCVYPMPMVHGDIVDDFP